MLLDLALEAWSYPIDTEDSRGNHMRITRDQFFFFFSEVGKLPNSSCRNQSLLKSIVVFLSGEQHNSDKYQLRYVPCFRSFWNESH